MRKIIGRKVYDTNTAQTVCDISPSGFSGSDFRWEDTKLYKSPKGQFFIAGEGGPMTRWAEPSGNNGTTGGRGLVLISDDAAVSLAERFASPGAIEIAFGKAEEG